MGFLLFVWGLGFGGLSRLLPWKSKRQYDAAPELHLMLELNTHRVGKFPATMIYHENLLRRLFIKNLPYPIYIASLGRRRTNRGTSRRCGMYLFSNLWGGYLIVYIDLLSRRTSWVFCSWRRLLHWGPKNGRMGPPKPIA